MNSDKKVVAIFGDAPPEAVEKQFGGIISRNAVLTIENSPFLLTSHVLVPEGVTLIIEPGVTVDLNGKFIQVDGTLRARGEPGRPIEIFAAAEGGGENYILFTSMSTSWNGEQESGSIIEYANLSVPAMGWGVDAVIVVAGASPRIANNSIVNLRTRGQSRAIVVTRGGSPVIEGNYLEGLTGIALWEGEARVIDNVIMGAQVGLVLSDRWAHQVKQNLIRDNWVGIELQCGSSTGTTGYTPGSLTENTIVSNKYGIKIRFISGSCKETPTIRLNHIHDNAEYNAYLQGISGDVDLTNNWWGTTDLIIIEKGLYHQPQDFRLGRILFEPFLTAPVDEAPNS